MGVGGASLLKNGSDVVRHAGGALEQKMKGGYERQTQMANYLMGGNMQNGLATMYGGNHMMMGGYYGQGVYGNYGGAGFSPGHW